MRFVVLAAVLLLGGCVEAVDLAEPVVLPPAYCAEPPNKVVQCESWVDRITGKKAG